MEKLRAFERLKNIAKPSEENTPERLSLAESGKSQNGLFSKYDSSLSFKRGVIVNINGVIVTQSILDYIKVK